MPKKRRRPNRLEPLTGTRRRYRISITAYDRRARSFKTIGLHATFDGPQDTAEVRRLFREIEQRIRGWSDDADAGGDSDRPEVAVVPGP